MIITLTLNPALDCVVRLPHFGTGELNRAEEEHLFAGGKGVNVARVLTCLGVRCEARGFLAGATGTAYEALLTQEGLPHAFTVLPDGFTRINTKIRAESETELNGIGPELSTAAVDALAESLTVLGAGDLLVLSGSVPKSAEGAYAGILERLRGNGVRTAVDTSGRELEKTLAFRPFIIKPNRAELAELAGVELRSEEAVCAAAEELRRLGAENVLVSLGAEGALLCTAEGVLCAEGVEGTVRSTVGAGDAMLAGFLAAWVKTGRYEDALRLGAAAGTATAFSYGTAGAEDIRRYTDRIRLRRL